MIPAIAMAISVKLARTTVPRFFPAAFTSVKFAERKSNKPRSPKDITVMFHQLVVSRTKAAMIPPKRRASPAARTATFQERTWMKNWFKFILVPLPFQDFHRKENTKEDEAQEIDHVPKIDDPGKEIVGVFEDREIFQEIPQGPLGPSAGRADHPKEQEHAKSDEGGNDLVLGKSGGQKPYCEETHGGQGIAKVIGEYRRKVRVPKGDQEGQVDERWDQCDQEK